MESGPPTPTPPPDDERGTGDAPPPGAPPSPQAPVQPSPAPPPGPESLPGGPHAPAPQAPAGAPAGPIGPESPAGYGGPVPPGGWQQPVATRQAWVGQPLASWGSRVAATLIDVLVLFIPIVVLFFLIVASAVGISGDDDVSTGAAIAAIILYVIVVSIVSLLYAPLLMMRTGEHNGQTLGKQLIGIRVVRNTGEPMGFGWAALREVVIKGLVVGIASSIIPVIPWLLDVLWPLWDDENRAIHDMIVSTHVVRA